MSPSPLSGFFVGVLVALTLDARFSRQRWDLHFCPKALHIIFHISLQRLWDPVGEHFKPTDVLEFGRLCIRLRLGFIDQQLEGGGAAGFVVVAGCSFFSTSTACTKKRRSGRLLASGRRR